MITTYHLADFYYLEALRFTARDEKDITWRHIDVKAKELQDVLIPQLADAVMSYLFAAAMGEARHAVYARTRDYYSPELNINPISGTSRSMVYNMCDQFDPRSNLPALRRIFDQPWGGGYGGEKWRDIVDAIEFYWTQSPTTFIDHVADLQHNNGTAFSKPTSEAIHFKCDFDDLISFLGYKKNYNLITQPEHLIHSNNYRLTSEVRSLVQLARGLLPGNPVTLEPLYGTKWNWTPIQWGDSVLTVQKKWKEYADVRMGNGMPIDTLLPYLRPYMVRTSHAFLWSIATPDDMEQLEEYFGSRNAILKSIQAIWNEYRPYDGKGFDALIEANDSKILAVVARFNRLVKQKQKEVMTGTKVPVDVSALPEYV